MSSTRREELSKILGKKLEECRVAIRNVRKDFNNIIRDAKKDKLFPKISLTAFRYFRKNYGKFYRKGRTTGT